MTEPRTVTCPYCGRKQVDLTLKGNIDAHQDPNLRVHCAASGRNYGLTLIELVNRNHHRGHLPKRDDE